jgi:hypothetical protein
MGVCLVGWGSIGHSLGYSWGSIGLIGWGSMGVCLVGWGSIGHSLGYSWGSIGLVSWGGIRDSLSDSWGSISLVSWGGMSVGLVGWGSIRDGLGDSWGSIGVDGWGGMSVGLVSWGSITDSGYFVSVIADLGEGFGGVRVRGGNGLGVMRHGTFMGTDGRLVGLTIRRGFVGVRVHSWGSMGIGGNSWSGVGHSLGHGWGSISHMGSWGMLFVGAIAH